MTAAAYPSYFYRYIDTLESAVAKAEEICSQYLTCSIEIYVFNRIMGDHYMLRTINENNVQLRKEFADPKA